jgi:LmbE family N-acetylglucosaminyl deacetylase
MKIMAFGPHPDDLEILCAGTLAKYKANGHDVAVVYVTNGEVGSPTLSKQETSALRRKEARMSAEIIGAEFFWLDYPDEFLFNSPEIRLNVIDTIRQFDPDVIISPDKDNDYHPDHTTTGQLIWDTHIMGTIPNIETKHDPCSKIAEVYFMDTIAGLNFRPEVYVDIAEQWHAKERMIRCHRSQEEWLKDQYGASLVDNAEVQSRFRGYQAGCKYAEAFRKPKFFPQTTKPLQLLP